MPFFRKRKKEGRPKSAPANYSASEDEYHRKGSVHFNEAPYESVNDGKEHKVKDTDKTSAKAIKEFYVTFNDHPTAVYRSGDRITGQLYIKLKDPMNMRALTLEFQGRCDIHWKTKGQTFKDKELYFFERATLFGSTTHGSLKNVFKKAKKHPAGVHIYPFQLVLPNNLPNSFEVMDEEQPDTYGYVRYTVKCVIERPWRTDISATHAFSVVSEYDLNLDIRSKEPVICRHVENLTKVMFETFPFVVRLEVKRAGHVPGEFVVLDGEVDNQTEHTISDINLEFRMVVTLKQGINERKVKKVIDVMPKGQLSSFQKLSWTGDSLYLPPIPPTELTYCSLIDIKYFAVLLVYPHKLPHNLVCPIEIIIGTVPNRDRFGRLIYQAEPAVQETPNILQTGLMSVDLTSGKRVMSQPAAKPLLRPVYAEYALGHSNIKKLAQSNHQLFGNFDFIPQYVFYQ